MRNQLLNRSIESEVQSSNSVEEEEKNNSSSEEEVKDTQPEETKRTGCFQRFNIAAIRMTFTLKGKEFFSTPGAKVIFISGIIAGLVALVYFSLKLGLVLSTSTQILPAVPESDVKELYFPGGVSHNKGSYDAKMTNLTRLVISTDGKKTCESLRKQVTDAGKKWEQAFGVGLWIATETSHAKWLDDQPLDCQSLHFGPDKNKTLFFFDLPEKIVDTTITLTSGDLSPEAVKKRANLKKASGIDSEIR